MRNAFREGQQIYFRALEVEDGALFQAWLADPENRQYLQRLRPLGAVEEREWLEGIHKREHDHVFAIALKEGDRLIGSCGLHRADLPNRSAELGIVIGERSFQGLGHGSEAMGLLLEYGFDTLGLHRVFLRVYANNPRGIRCYEKCGFVREGVHREARWWGGRWWDILEYGILEHEWRRAARRP